MGKKPSYVGLLNAIAIGEGEAELFLKAWADKTKDKKVEKTLRFVALREGEHAKAFEKRLAELGYGLRPNPKSDLEERMKIALSRKADKKKFEELGVGREPESDSDIFDGMFQDKTLDPQTGGLLGRYIAEERDSGRMLRACYDSLS